MPGEAVVPHHGRVSMRGSFTGVLYGAIFVLAATVLIQQPLVAIDSGFGIYLVRAWDIAFASVVAVACAWVLVSRDARTGLQRTRDPAFLLFAGWVAVLLTSLLATWMTFGSDGFGDAVVRGVRLATVLILASVVSVVAAGRRRRQGLVLCLGVIGLLGAASATVAWVTKDKTVGTEVFGITRAGGPFGNFFADGAPDAWWVAPAGPNNLGLWLATFTATLVAGAKGVASAFRAPLVGWAAVAIALLIFSLGLLATHSRESWLAVGGATAALVLLKQDVRRSRRVLGIAVVAALVVALSATLPSVGDRVADTFTPGTFAFETGPQARLEAWSDGLHWSWERFPVGWGLGSMEEHPEAFGRGTAENMFLQTFVAAGPLGLLLLIAAITAAGIAAIQRYRSPGADLSAVFPAAFFVVLTIHGLFGNSVSDPTVHLLLACALGLLLAGRSYGGRNVGDLG